MQKKYTMAELKAHHKLVVALNKKKESLVSLIEIVSPGKDFSEDDIKAAREEFGPEFDALEQEIDELQKRADAEQPQLEEYFRSLKDAEVQTFCRLHYLRGYLWKEVAAMFHKSEDAVKGLCSTRIKKASS